MVKVADFGLARAVTAPRRTNATGVLLGTVAYLSPEQVERGIADARTDVYAAGLRALRDAHRHASRSTVTPRSTWPTSTCTAPCPPPSQPVRDRARRSSTSWSRCATARDPDKRPADAGDFLAEVRRHAPGLTPPSWTCDPARPRLPRSWPPRWRCPGRGGGTAATTDPNRHGARDGRTAVVPVPQRDAGRRRATVRAVGGPGRCSCSPSSRLRPARGSSSPARAPARRCRAVVSLPLTRRSSGSRAATSRRSVDRAFDEKAAPASC